MNSLRLLALPAALAALLLSGCHITTRDNGKNQNVEIGTPFGSMSVKTNDDANTAGLGLTPYPGATSVKDKDDHAADVNMNFGSFHLGVRTSSYQTGDPAGKVVDFYRKYLARYGDVIECRGNQPVGQPTRTAEGLSCDLQNGHEINVRLHSGLGIELRAGSPGHQHVVAIGAKNGGTRIALIELNLPLGSGHSGAKQTE